MVISGVLAALLILFSTVAGKTNFTSALKKRQYDSKAHAVKIKTRTEQTAGGSAPAAASSLARIDRSVGRMHLHILRWYCEENGSSHGRTLPCENYSRLLSALGATTRAEKEAVDAERQAASPKTAAERVDRARLVKSSYAAMKKAFCNVPSHALACVNPDLGREYEELASAPAAPAEALDRKAYHVLTISKRRAKANGGGGRLSGSGPLAASAAVEGKGKTAGADSYLSDEDQHGYDPPG